MKLSQFYFISCNNCGDFCPSFTGQKNGRPLEYKKAGIWQDCVWKLIS